jgi:hypothetical protein
VQTWNRRAWSLIIEIIYIYRYGRFRGSGKGLTFCCLNARKNRGGNCLKIAENHESKAEGVERAGSGVVEVNMSKQALLVSTLKSTYSRAGHIDNKKTHANLRLLCPSFHELDEWSHTTVKSHVPVIKQANQRHSARERSFGRSERRIACAHTSNNCALIRLSVRLSTKSHSRGRFVILTIGTLAGINL